MKEIEKFTLGMVCGDDWSIEFDALIEDFAGDPKPCPHSYGEHYIEHEIYFDGSTYKNKAWHCPRVLRVTPDDPYQCAAVCLDCLLEKLIELGMDKPVLLAKPTN